MSAKSIKREPQAVYLKTEGKNLLILLGGKSLGYLDGQTISFKEFKRRYGGGVCIINPAFALGMDRQFLRT